MKTKKYSGKKTVTLLVVIALSLLAVVVTALVLVGRFTDKKAYENSYESAMIYYIGGDYDGAISMLREASEYDDTEECRVLLARSYAAMGDFDTAAATLSDWLADHSGSEAEGLFSEYQAMVSDTGEDGTVIEIAGQEVESDAESLILTDAEVTAEDMSAIGGLTDLTNLSLGNCGLDDISALSSLSELKSLILSGNEISDLSPLSGLTSLRTLYLDDNPVTDFSPLYGLSSLTTLNIKGIEITETELSDLREALPDCSVYSENAVVEAEEITLGGVTFLSDVTELDLSGKEIDDISELSKCIGLTKLNLKDNHVSDLTPLVDLPNLTWLCLWNNEVTDLSPLMGLTTLEYLDADANQITKITALSGLTGLKELYLSGNPLKSVSPLINLTELNKLGLKNTGLDDGDLGALTVLINLQELYIEDNADLTGDAVDALKLALSGCTVTHSELVYMIKLGTGEYRTTDTVVDASGKSVGDLTDVIRFEALTTFIANNNSITDISPLYTLDGLEALELSSNAISDLGPLEDHGRLKVLNLMKNDISDISALASCTALTELHLSYNSGLEDLSALAACAALTELSLDYTGVFDLSPISGLVSLVTLGLDGCPIADAAPLYHLTNLRTLYIGGSSLSEEQLLDLRAALPNCDIYS